MIARALAALLLALATAGWARGDAAGGADPSGRFFAGPVHRIEVVIGPESMEALRRDPRSYARGTVTVDGVGFPDVALRVKGSAGSRRPIDDRPALTLDLDRFVPGRELAGMVKLHLNNSVQDRSRLNEWVGSRAFRRAGIPTARVTHALVRLNRHDLGLYVVKEGYDGRFVRRHFDDAGGRLYDGGFLRDIDGGLDLDAGPEPDDGDGLRRLREACAVEDPAERLAALDGILDAERFLTFAALEILLEHWDGYCLHSNNYRLYHQPARDRFVFVPHGMDQLFGRASMPLDPGFRGQVAQALFSVPGQRERLLQRIEGLLAGAFHPDALRRDIDEGEARLREALAARPRQEAWAIEEEIAYLRDGVAARVANAREQLASRPRPVRLDPGSSVELGGWRPRGFGPDGPPAWVELDGESLLHLRGGPGAGAPGWRLRRVLGPGRYRVEVGVRLAGVPTEGAGLRLRLPGLAGSDPMTGDAEDALLAAAFEIREEREVEVSVDLGSTSGEAWIRPRTARLVRLD